MIYILNGYPEKNKEDDKLSNYAYKSVTDNNTTFIEKISHYVIQDNT